MTTPSELDGCIWRGNQRHLNDLPQGDPQSWAGSVQYDLKALGMDPDLVAQPGPFGAYLACAALLLVKDEADIVHANLAWLYYTGVRRFVVMDNASTDGTAGRVAAFQAAHADVELVVVQDPILGYFQARKVSAMMQFAATLWPDVAWLFPVDADELLCTRFGLRALVYVPDGIDALTVPKVIHFFDRDDTGPDPDGFDPGRMTVRSSPFAVPPKVIVRASRDLDVEQGNHGVACRNGRVRYAGGLQYGFFHREFQTRSFAQFLSKVRNGGAALTAAKMQGATVGGEHWLRWYETLTVGGEAALLAEYRDVAFRSSGGGYKTERFTLPG